MRKYLILILVLVAALLIAGCTSKPAPQQNTTSTPNQTPVQPVPAVNQSPPQEEVNLEDVADQARTYLKAHPVAAFPNLENRIIEVEIDGNLSMLRFRKSTPNPRQESTYLLGVQFLTFPGISVANATGYNEEGKIIMDPDSRTQETRSIYWKKYRTQASWFPNLALQAECKIDTDCNDSDNCTKDICLEDGFCSNSRIVGSSCPVI